jgi:hypothetical protein
MRFSVFVFSKLLLWLAIAYAIKLADTVHFPALLLLVLGGLIGHKQAQKGLFWVLGSIVVLLVLVFEIVPIWQQNKLSNTQQFIGYAGAVLLLVGGLAGYKIKQHIF